ncbi:carbohydrate-binding protein [Photobacterium kishitanii]|uniref:M66 family metalloprotease n=1 Tax=Photobacterium kishitanii TaxID=318456 RepID=UPI000D16A383|nr:M66 family metalloprotease [Photobacterium kishitanii]PSU92144.1 carbohydrate-binding protein [Photobacterium kishitanii]
MKVKYLASIFPVLMMSVYGNTTIANEVATGKIYFNQKELPSDTQGTLPGNVSIAQSVIMQSVNKIADDRQPHLVSLRKALVLFEPSIGEIISGEAITLIAKNAHGEVVHQALMQLPQNLPKIVGQIDQQLNITKPDVFSHTVSGNGPLHTIQGEQGKAAFKALLLEYDAINVTTSDGSWAQHFILADDPAFNNKTVTFTSWAGYNSTITYSQGTDTISNGNELTYKNIDGIWYAKADQDINRIAYSDKAYSAILPAEAVLPELQLSFVSESGKEGLVNEISVGAYTHLILNAVDIGLLTPPRDEFVFIKDHELQRQYFQNTQISKLTVNPYQAVHLTEIMLPDGRLLVDVDPSTADAYGSDSHYRIARELISSGINSANYGVNSSSVRPQSQWNIDAVYHAAQVTVNNSRGNYSSGVINHGLLGSYRGVASVVSSTGNEFSHEVGHEFGVGNHYPGGFKGAVHNSSINKNSTWGWDVHKNLFIPNFSKGINNQTSCYEGECAQPFAGHSFGFGTMSGGWPQHAKYNAYTLHTPYELSIFQDFLENKANFDALSPTGFSKWNHELQQMQPWTNSAADDLAFVIKYVSDNDSLNQFGEQSDKFQTLLAQADAVKLGLGNGYWARDFYLPTDDSLEGKIISFESWAGWTAYIHYNKTTIALNHSNKYAFKFINGQWQSVDSDILNKSIELTPYKQGIPVTTLVGYYDPDKTLPSYIYPALHGAYGSVYADGFTDSSCQLDVFTRNGGTKTFNLHNRRLQAGMMNRFHINIETALQPYQAQVRCGNEQLDSLTIEPASVTLKAQITTTEAGEAPTIYGVTDVVIQQGQHFDVMAGVSAIDDYDGDVSASIVVDGAVDNTTAGYYSLTYKAYDSAASETVTVRQVEVFSEKPIFSGISDSTISLGEVFDPRIGVQAMDAEDGDLTANIQIAGSVNTDIAGSYVLTYQIVDSASHIVTATRTVTVEGEPVCDNLWLATATYVAGDQVSHKGALWQAGWWTQAEEPSTTGEWGVWKQIADSGCSIPKPEITPPVEGEYPAYQANGNYKAGDKVTAIDGNIYQCKPWPATGWCNNSAYAPGDSYYWSEAWIQL